MLLRGPTAGTAVFTPLGCNISNLILQKENTVKHEHFRIKAETFHTSNYTGGNAQGLKHRPSSMLGTNPHTLSLCCTQQEAELNETVH